MDDPLESAFQSRRFAHGKSKAKSGRGGGGGVSKPFNPSAALGQYAISLGGGTSKTSQQYILEIHELTECETGLLGTFDFGRLKGMFVLAGSRKGLAEIITGLEEEEDEGKEEKEDDDNADAGGEESHGYHTTDDLEKCEEHELSAIELQDEKVNRRARAFEKNSFRNPKFWMKWKGTQGAAAGTESADLDHVESNMGYLVFANNACDKFEGTVTCPSLDWEQLKLKGRKVHCNATSCPMEWNGVH